MNLPKFVFVLAALLAGSVALAQSNTQYTVILKNGSIVHGEAVGDLSDGNIKIKNDHGDVFVFGLDEMVSASKDSVSLSRGRFSQYAGSGSPARGYRGFVDGNFLCGETLDFQVQTTHGFQFNPRIFAGAGIGLGCLDLCGVSIFYGAFRYDILPKNVTPFVDFRLGGYSWWDDYSGGAFIGVTVGARIRRFNVSLGYEGFSGYDEDIDTSYGDYYYSTDRGGLSALTLRFGADFGRRN